MCQSLHRNSDNLIWSRDLISDKEMTFIKLMKSMMNISIYQRQVIAYENACNVNMVMSSIYLNLPHSANHRTLSAIDSHRQNWEIWVMHLGLKLVSSIVKNGRSRMVKKKILIWLSLFSTNIISGWRPPIHPVMIKQWQHIISLPYPSMMLNLNVNNINPKWWRNRY